jgi:hypothetical protein
LAKSAYGCLPPYQQKNFVKKKTPLSHKTVNTHHGGNNKHVQQFDEIVLTRQQ